MSADPPPDPVLALGQILGTAIAEGVVDREELFDVARQVIAGSDRVGQRLGVAVASAVIAALQTGPRPAPTDPVAIAEQAFAKPWEQP